MTAAYGNREFFDTINPIHHHCGPGNTVKEEKSSGVDEICRKHDLAYNKIGYPQAYLAYNEADSEFVKDMDKQSGFLPFVYSSYFKLKKKLAPTLVSERKQNMRLRSGKTTRGIRHTPMGRRRSPTTPRVSTRGRQADSGVFASTGSSSRSRSRARSVLARSLSRSRSRSASRRMSLPGNSGGKHQVVAHRASDKPMVSKTKKTKFQSMWKKARENSAHVALVEYNFFDYATGTSTSRDTFPVTENTVRCVGHYLLDNFDLRPSKNVE